MSRFKLETADSLTCRVAMWGMAFTESGYTVSLYKNWPYVPLIQKEVARSVINETEPGSNPSPATCNDIYAEYIKKNNH